MKFITNLEDVVKAMGGMDKDIDKLFDIANKHANTMTAQANFINHNVRYALVILAVALGVHIIGSAVDRVNVCKLNARVAELEAAAKKEEETAEEG